jgi:hypothetical protein
MEVEPHDSEAEAAADGGACTAEQLLTDERKRVRRPASLRHPATGAPAAHTLPARLLLRFSC